MALAVPRRVVFLPEGYDETEYDLFFEDVRRLVRQVISDESAPFSFAQKYLAVDAKWVSSKSSGIPFSTYASKKHTAFGLFRNLEAPLRLVEASSWSYRAAREACGDCSSEDVVVVVANDDFYGGLGDDVVIATRSLSSGALALRHELGHVLGDLGEEYDGGEDYSGDNFAKLARPCAPNEVPAKIFTEEGFLRRVWPCSHWIDNESSPSPPRSSSSRVAIAEWPFAAPPLTRRFKSHLPRAVIDISVAGGLGVVVYVDEALVLAFAPSNLDRSFATATVGNLRGRNHVIRVNSTTRPPPEVPWPPPILCHIQVRLEEDAIGPPFATFDARGRIVGYRPTYRDCLMRDVALSCFCPVCRRAILDRILDFVLRNNYRNLEGSWHRHGLLSIKPPPQTMSRLKPSPTGCWQLTVDATPELSSKKSITLEDPSCSYEQHYPRQLPFVALLLAIILFFSRHTQRRQQACKRRGRAGDLDDDDGRRRNNVA